MLIKYIAENILSLWIIKHNVNQWKPLNKTCPKAASSCPGLLLPFRHFESLEIIHLKRASVCIPQQTPMNPAHNPSGNIWLLVKTLSSFHIKICKVLFLIQQLDGFSFFFPLPSIQDLFSFHLTDEFLFFIWSNVLCLKDAAKVVRMSWPSHSIEILKELPLFFSKVLMWDLSQLGKWTW